MGLLEERPHHLPARRVSQGVQDPVLGMRALPGQVEPPFLPVEAGPPGRELADPLRPFLDEDAGRRLGDDPRPGLQGVLEVLLRGVVLPQGHRHPALGVARVALGRLILRHHEDRARTGQAEGRP